LVDPVSILGDMTAVPVDQAARHLHDLIDQVNDDEVAVEIVTDHGTAVLISIAEYGAIRETEYLLSNRANADHLALAIEQADHGDLHKIDLDRL